MIGNKDELPYFEDMAQSLRITSKGQLTLKRETLAHLGVQAGQSVSVELRPNGIVELRPVPAGKISDAFGCLPRPNRPALTIEEMNDVIAAA